MPSTEEIKQQSLAAYNQWQDQWREQAKQNSSFKMKSFDDFRNVGIGKAILVVANGYSFEENIKIIKEKSQNIDILCCDKTLGALIENGIRPKYCLVCDANVDYEKYMQPYEDQLGDTVLFMNVCGNPKWSHNGNWKDKYFFVNQDILKSEREFSKLSGCKNLMPAATNVSGAMVVLLTQCDNKRRNNFFGYDKMLLIGFDYSWKRGQYYSYDHTGGGKDFYMRHLTVVNLQSELCHTSNNLLFSMRWLSQYIKTFRLPVVQCTKNTILSVKKMCDLEGQLDYNYKQEDLKTVQDAVKLKEDLMKKIMGIDRQLMEIGKDHQLSYLATT